MGKRTKESEVSPKGGRGAAVRDITLLILFTAIIIVMAFTPVGFIELPVVAATMIHVPVIVGSVLLGPKKGAFLGLVFGLASLVRNSVAPVALSFVFSPLISVPGAERGSVWALVVCLIPRVLVGVTPWLIYKFGRLFTRRAGIAGRGVVLAIAAAVGSLTNTVLVTGLIYTFFKDACAAVQEVPKGSVSRVLLGVVGTNGMIELLAAAVVTVIVCLPLLRLLRLESKPADPREAAAPEPADPAVPASPDDPAGPADTADPTKP